LLTVCLELDYMDIQNDVDMKEFEEFDQRSEVTDENYSSEEYSEDEEQLLFQQTLKRQGQKPKSKDEFHDFVVDYFMKKSKTLHSSTSFNKLDDNNGPVRNRNTVQLDPIEEEIFSGKNKNKKTQRKSGSSGNGKNILNLDSSNFNRKNVKRLSKSPRNKRKRD